MFGRGRGGGGGGRQVCQFYLEGRCKFGNNCKNEHPPGQEGGQSQGGFGNRFSALNNQGGARGRSGAFGSGQGSQDSNPYNISGETIRLDLTTERPIWPLSSYGPGKNAPLQLMEGDIEQSPEEMRVKHYLAMAQGNPQESAQLEANTANKANEVIQRILGDIDGAVKYIIDGKDQHPNRLDMENKGSGAQSAQQQTPFGAPSTPAATGFGQPSSMGQQGSAFGKPAFGQSSAPQSTFGQASTFGKPAQPGFGQASAMGGGGSAFGQPSNPGQTSAFGQPSAMGGGGGSAFGQPSNPGQSTGFGQPSQMGQKPAFGQASTFGQPAQPAFGQASKPAFGQASNPSPFGAAASQPSGFAQAAQQPSSGFGQPSAFGAAASKPSPFASAGSNQQQQQQQSPFASAGSNQQQQSPFAAAASNNNANQQQPQQQQNPFGSSSQPAFGQPSQPAAAAANPFGSNAAKPAFGQTSQPAASPFGQPSQPSPASNPFGQPSQPQQQQQPTASPFGAPATQQQQQQSTNPSSSQTATATPHPSTYLLLNAQSQPQTFKTHPVTYLPAPKAFHAYNLNGKPEHLWFPQGPPAANPDVQIAGEDEEGAGMYYGGEMGRELKAIYDVVNERGVFPEGVGMPEVPPSREWVRFDL